MKIKLLIFSASLLFLFCLSIFSVSPLNVQAASTVTLSPASGSYVIGNNFSVSVNVNTGSDTINAVEGSITFDKTKLAVSSVDTNSSILKIWVSYPSYSNTTGTISFSGGVPNPGFSGTGQLFTINFKGIALGSGSVSFSSGEKILLNDGSGTNVFSGSTGGTYSITPSPLAVYCSASPNGVALGQNITFNASASGESGSYTYKWSGSCTGTSNSCAVSFDTTGVKTVTVAATSNGKTTSASCSATVGLPGLNVSCTPFSQETDVGQPVTFNAVTSGGNGNYSYLWSGDCTGTSNTCTNTFDTKGFKTATVKVSSEGANSISNCYVAANSSSCTQNTSSSVTFVQVPVSTTNANYTPSECEPLLKGYIKLGAQNDPTDVTNLQTFLNTYYSANLKVDGIYKTEDVNAVEAFQIRNSDTLSFWNLTEPTGYVYDATQKAVNRINCEKLKNLTCPYFTEQKNGYGNLSASEISKIRNFLNLTQGENLSAATTYDGALKEAIARFQTKYSNKVLTPWNLAKPTGIWYQSTRKKADEILGCFYPFRLDNGKLLQ